MKKPSEHLSDLLNGYILWEDAPDYIKSWARLEIHNAAVYVLALPKEKRDAFFKRVPEGLHQMIKDEANRVYLWRRKRS